MTQAKRFDQWSSPKTDGAHLLLLFPLLKKETRGKKQQPGSCQSLKVYLANPFFFHPFQFPYGKFISDSSAFLFYKTSTGIDRD
jgi:hypothetical protein